MIIKKARMDDLQQIYNLTQDTILNVYKNVYTQCEIDFFADLHSKENIAKDIVAGYVFVLSEGREILATATIEKNHITRVFVEKSHIGQGLGSKIMDFVEDIVALKYDESTLDTSLFAKNFYLHRGYLCDSANFCQLKNGKMLEYDIMKKNFTEGKI